MQLSLFDTQIEVPSEVIEAACIINDWAKTSNLTHWSIGYITSRESLSACLDECKLLQEKYRRLQGEYDRMEALVNNLNKHIKLQGE